MKPSSFALSIAILALGLLPARPAPLDDRIAELKHAVQKEAAAKAEQAPAAQNGFRNPALNGAVIAASIDQLVAQMLNSGNGANSDAELAQLTSFFTSDEVQEATTNLLAEIHKQRKERADAEAAEWKALLQRVTTKVNTATKPEDLDDLVVELQKHRGGYGGGMQPADQALAQQVNAAFEFVQAWQNYLSHVATGQAQLAQNDLQNLTQNNSGDSFIPRSKLLALMDQVKTPPPGASPPPPPGAAATAAILANLKTLDDIAPALQKLKDPSVACQDATDATNDLNTLEQGYEAIQAGLPFSVYTLNFPNKLTFAPLRSQLIILMFSRSFTTYKGPAAGPGDTPESFLEHVVADATSREDWVLLRQAFYARSTLHQYNVYAQYTNVATAGADALLDAVNQETAGQYAPAVVSYEQALKVADPDIPAKFIGRRLAGIEKDHPAEYAAGLKAVNDAATSAAAAAATPMNMYSRFGYPYGFPPPASAPAPVPIPAVAPSPNAAATTSPSTNAPPPAPPAPGK